MRFILLMAFFCGSAVLAADQQSSDGVKAQDLQNVTGSDEIVAIGNDEQRPLVQLNTAPEPQVAEVVGDVSSNDTLADGVKAQDLQNVTGSDEIVAIGNNEQRPQVQLNTAPEPQVAEVVGDVSSEDSSSSSSSSEEEGQQGPPPPPPHHGGPPSPPHKCSHNSPGHHRHPGPAMKSHETPHSEAESSSSSSSSSEDVADGKKDKKKKEGFRKKVARKIKEKARKLKKAFHRRGDSSSSQENEEKKNKETH